MGDGETQSDGNHPQSPGRLIRGLTISRTLYQVTALPIALITSIGKVNDADYISALLVLTFAAETLLYTPPNMNRTITTAGDKGWTVNMKFMYKPDTWNKFWRSTTQAYEAIFIAGGIEYKNYPLADFSSLLF